MGQIIAKIIKDATIKDINIAALTITNGKFADTTINSDQYASNSIDGEKLSAQCQTDILDSKKFTFQSKVLNVLAGISYTLNVSEKVYDILTVKGLTSYIQDYSGVLSAYNLISSDITIKNHITGDPIDNGSGKQVFGRMVDSKIGAGTTIPTQGSPIVTGTFSAITFPVGTILTFLGSTHILYKVIAVQDNQITLDRNHETGIGSATTTYKQILSLTFIIYTNPTTVAYFTMSNQSIDFYPYERAALSVIPKDALQTILEGYPEILPLNHNHTVFTLSSDLESTSTGKGADLFGLNGGSQSNLGAEIRAVSDVTRLDTRYYTETELSDTGTGTSGSAKIGYDTGLGASTVQSQIDSINTDASGLYTEHTEKKTIVTLNTIPSVTYTPQVPGSARMSFRGIVQDDGFTLNTNKTATWNPTNGGFNLDVSDEIYITYSVKISDLP